MNVLLYARVSSHKQAEKDLSIGAQLRALRAFAHEQGWTVVAEFVDKAVSGRTARRPGLVKMLHKVKRGGVDAVLVWKLDRLARNMEVSALIDGFFRTSDVKLISLHESFDDSPQGRFIARMFESLAEFYSNNLSQDICRGIREVARRGFYPHGRPPIGYKTAPVEEGTAVRKKLVPDEALAPVVRRMFSMYLSGKGGREIANALNKEGVLTNAGKRWSPQRVYSVLRNPIYVGDIVLGAGPHSSENQEKLRMRDVHEPLITREEFERVQELLDWRGETPGAPRWHHSPYLLSGLARCGKCGAALCGTSAKSGQFHYYTCSRYYKEGKGSCLGVRVRKEKLETFVPDKLLTVVLALENLERLVELVNDELTQDREGIGEEVARLEREIAAHRSRLSRLFDALETGKLELEDLAPRIKELRKAIKDLEERNERLLEAREPRGGV
jgi:DNA invertase Pin-like site-specific DNA recombinase